MEMEHITIENPTVEQSDQDLLLKYFQEGDVFRPYYDAVNEPKYLFWTKAKHKPNPRGYTDKQAWLTTRIIRKVSSLNTPVKTPSNNTFTYLRLPNFDKILHTIDLQVGGKFLVTRTNAEDRQKFLSRGILEEAIASSQLEGASTSRRYAKKMIAEQRKPRNTSEWMIYNNYLTLSAIDEDYKEKELSRELLLEIHSRLTDNTLDDPEDVGRFRLPGDGVNVIYDEKIAHVAPSSEFVSGEIDKLIKYANDDDHFIHPIIKASILHFWMGYLHPFADGNGRIARSLFYWYLLKHDYWGMAYIPISLVIKRAVSQYTYAYIYAEQDNFDLTYFIDYSLRRVVTALNEFEHYVENLKDENRLIESRLRNVVQLNDRQKQMTYFLLSDDVNYVTEKSHKTMNGIARNTARADIKRMFGEGLLDQTQEGRTLKYYASDRLKKLMAN